MQGGVVRHAVDHAVPETPRGRSHRGREGVARFHGANLDRAHGGRSSPHDIGQLVGKRQHVLALGIRLSGGGTGGMAS